MPTIFYTVTEYEALADEAAALQRRVTALETLRPAWAMGHTSDSVAAQASAAALAQVWCALGAANQTEAMVALRGLQEANAKQHKEITR